MAMTGDRASDHDDSTLAGRAPPGVDMSTAAIERRLATVGALYKLMCSLMTATPMATPPPTPTPDQEPR